MITRNSIYLTTNNGEKLNSKLWGLLYNSQIQSDTNIVTHLYIHLTPPPLPLLLLQDIYKRTVFHYVAINGNVSLLEALCVNGSGSISELVIDSIDDGGDTALLLAVKKQHKGKCYC